MTATASLDTFAKVRTLHDRTTNAGEKAAAMTKMRTLARKAGLSVEEAVSKVDTKAKPSPESGAQATADAFNAFFNSPEMRAERAEREAKRRVKAAGIIEAFGSEDAVFADTPMEAALRTACEPLLGPGETWNMLYRLDGWGGLDSRAKMPASVGEAVAGAWPMPETVAEAWAEFEATDRLTGDRYTVDYHCDPHLFVEARRYIVEDLLNTQPAKSLNDVRARLSWMEWHNNREITPDLKEERVRLATLRADIERMGRRIREQGEGEVETTPSVQDGQEQGGSRSEHPRRTNADKRRDVLTLLRDNAEESGIAPLSDREIARRVGVSPQTVGNIRRSPA